MIYPILLCLLLIHNGERKVSIECGGRTRTFILYKPERLQGLAPLVIALHGRLGTGAGMEHLTHFESVADSEKFILIYPDGVRKSWNDGRGTPAEWEGVDDVGFIRELIDSAVRHCGADPIRVYITGISNGGFMALRLATALPDRIAAVAAVAASLDEATAKDSANVSPMPVLLMHGTKDPLVPYRGGSVRSGAGGSILSHASSVNWWKNLDGCKHVVPDEIILDSANDGTTIGVTDYNNGKNGAEVMSYIVYNGGHTWPGGWQYLPVFKVGKTSRNLDASEAIWEFFSRHRKE